jgi:plastocyanin
MSRLLNRFVLLIAAAGILAATAGLAQAKPASGPWTYTVMVGLEHPHSGIGINAYFPGTVTIHEGDTVHWVQNSNEIHTVTFPDGIPLPALLLPPPADSNVSPLVFNPAAIEQVPACHRISPTPY